MTMIGIRELKAHLSKYLHQVEKSVRRWPFPFMGVRWQPSFQLPRRRWNPKCGIWFVEESLIGAGGKIDFKKQEADQD